MQINVTVAELMAERTTCEHEVQPVLRLVHITQCMHSNPVPSLVERGLLVSDGETYVLTERAKELVLLDEAENPYR
jgi:hypothetical protein